MGATLVDEGRAPACRTVELATMRRAALGELVGAIAHAMLPLSSAELLSLCRQALGDVRHAARAAEVDAESSEAEVNDVSVRVVEPRQHRRAGKVDHSRLRAAQCHELGPAGGHNTPAGDRQVSLWLEAGAPKGANPAAREDQISSQAIVRLSACLRSTCAQTR